MPFTYHSKTYDLVSPKRPELHVGGKSVLITGGGYGIGAVIARSFATAGASRIAMSGRTEWKLKGTAESLQGEFPESKFEYYVANIIDQDAIARMFSAFGTPDILVNNAGAITAGPTFKDANLKSWWSNIEVNLLGTTVVSQQYLRAKESEKEGMIIMLNSAAAHWGALPGFSGYVASKAAVGRMSELIHVENPEVRVVNVNPGFVATGMLEHAEKAGLVGMLTNDAELVGDFIVWACSKEAEFLSGRFMWATWDAKELMEKREEIEEKELLRFGLDGLGAGGLL